jgi:hypothetical protein
MKPVRSLAPLLRGEGWGEGLSPQPGYELIENNSLLDSARSTGGLRLSYKGRGDIARPVGSQ